MYQCFAPQDAFTVQAQTDAQKRKIRDDIYKLVSKPEETVELLGEGYRITRWVLLTPELRQLYFVTCSESAACLWRRACWW